MATYESKYVKCPYYRYSARNLICCDGTEDSNTVHIVFNNPKDLKAHAVLYCNDIFNYHNCLLCQMQDRRYEDDK